ncbi:MAG TPA: dihydroorotase [Acidobacteriaceae bacterium]
MKPILIRGGRVIDPASRLDAQRDVLLRDGKVAALENPGTIQAPGAEVFDAKGLIVAPGLIDIHVHLREPGQAYKETIATGTAAAAAGGFTTVCAMPNTVPVNDSPEITRWMQAEERGASARVFPIAAATRGSLGASLTEYAALKDAGAIAVTDDGKPILDDAIMLQALRAAAPLALPVIQHAEDTRLTGGCSMNAGALAFRLGLRGMPVEAESGLVERDIALLKKVKNGHLHVAHLSTKKALDAVRAARKSGLHVTCEVTPHHFALTEDRIGLYDTNAKMNPPLRAESDRAAMIEGLLDGTIDAIATDHAPHAAHEKEQEFDRAPNGITGLETALGLAISILHARHKMPLAAALALLTSRPAQALGLTGCGTLSIGSAADVVVFDPAEKWTFRAADSRSKSKNTPFDGTEMQGRVHATIREGHMSYSRWRMAQKFQNCPCRSEF